MYRRVIRLTSTILLTLVLVFFPTMFTSAQQTSGSPQTDVQGEIDELLKTYGAALQNELTYGTTQLVVDPTSGPTRLLVGDSQTKMDQLWADTVDKIDALQARPAAERVSTVEMLQQVSGNSPTYISRDHSPYDPSVELEEYNAGKYIFDVDIASGQIVKAWLKDQTDYRVVATYTEGELATMARNYAARIAPELTLDRLALSVLNKDKEVYFFRWENSASQMADGLHPFVQVAFSRSGDFLNYENTLPLSTPTSNAVTRLLAVAPATALGANEYYSNGGSQWGWERQDASYSTQNNAGYCYTQGSWCTPKNYYYAASPSGNNTYSGSYHRGKWTATSTMRYLNTKISAYIPCSNATTTVPYYAWYNGGSSSGGNMINQQSWCNTWVVASSQLYDIQRVVLANTNEKSGSYQIAWDEIWDYVP